jgi:hypothetical protein
MVCAETALIVFSRKPVPGQVKTRLIGTLGEEGAAALQRRLLAGTLETGCNAGFGAIELYCAPDCDDPFLRDCAVRYDASLFSQEGNDLGERMANALTQTLSRHANAILIGSDAPSLTMDDLRFARSAIESDQLVIGPAEDGGYVLIGMTGRHRRAGSLMRFFTGVAWGRAGVMETTRCRLTALGEPWVELSVRWDVDTPEDLCRLNGSINPRGVSP